MKHTERIPGLQKHTTLGCFSFSHEKMSSTGSDTLTTHTSASMFTINMIRLVATVHCRGVKDTLTV